ncbi:hypothetical protein [Chitinimonas sp. JJ19]|uniref:hypothetical protein n=1 Tax=Chitinimonas sp. JJ19 TaxID=3109352 RepID=UPI001A5B0353|nr:hypothetical protein [Chitinimonas sp.]
MTRMHRHLGSIVLCAIGVLAAQAEPVLVAGSKSPAVSFSRQQVQDIYYLRLKEFPGGGVIVPLMLGAGPVRQDFLDKVLNKSEAQLKSHWARLNFTGKGVAPQQVASTAELKRLLAANPHMVGYLDRAEADASVKILYAP